jgi:F-type H+-transporting ATPase subunit delta
MKISKESRKLAKQLFQASFTNDRLDGAKVRGLVRSIVQSKPRHHLEVLKEFQRLVRLELEKHHAVIESAVPLDQETSQRVAGDLRRRYGADLATDFAVNPALIGGLRIRIGSDLWDGSVRARLDRLETELATS